MPLLIDMVFVGHVMFAFQCSDDTFYSSVFQDVLCVATGIILTFLEGLSEPEFYGDLVYKFKKLQKNDYTLQTYRV